MSLLSEAESEWFRAHSSGELDDTEPDKKSAATKLVELAQGRYDFGVSESGEAFALPRSGPKIVHLLRGSKQSLRAQLAREFFRKNKKAAPQQALADALLVIEGMAQENEPTELYLRVAKAQGALWLDLGDQSGRVIRICGDGWTVKDSAPVLFKRTILNSSLPVPERGGSLDDLWRRINVRPEDRPLLLAYLVAALEPDLPHPVLTLLGEQGTGKTTTAKLLVTLLDPSPVPTRKPPRDAESWVTAAQGSWLVCLDNLSDVPPWLSDSICRAVTGDGDVRRKLYTDGDHAVFAFRRVVMINSIDLGATRGDLAERMLPVHLDVIHEDQRLGEDEIWPTWEQEHPKILGALLDLAAGIAGVLPSVRLASKPRMADFAKRIAAVDQVLGTSGLEHYLGKQKTMATDSLTGDDFIMAVQSLGEFEGTAADLLKQLEHDRPPKGWPRNARAVTTKLKRQATQMRKAGWKIQDGENTHRKVTVWTIVPPDHSEIARISYPHTPHSPQIAGQAGIAGNEYEGSQDDEVLL